MSRVVLGNRVVKGCTGLCQLDGVEHRRAENKQLLTVFRLSTNERLEIKISKHEYQEKATCKDLKH